MQISPLQIYKTLSPLSPRGTRLLTFKYRLKYAGFSLIEILVALTLISLIVFIIPNPFENHDRNRLQETADQMTRGLKMGIDEAILRGVLTRLYLDFNSQPAKYSLEFGDKNQNLLPNFDAMEEEKGLTLQEEEFIQKKLEQFDKNFNPIADFSEKEIEIPEGVYLLGASSNIHPQLQTEGRFALYSYPSGERDSAIIFLATDQEILAIVAEGLTGALKQEFFPLEKDLSPDEQRVQKIKEIHELWATGKELRP